MKKVTLENLGLEDTLQLIYNEIAKRNGDESLFVDWGKDFSEIENEINMAAQIQLVRMRGIRLTKKTICAASTTTLNKMWGYTVRMGMITKSLFLFARNNTFPWEIRNKLQECFETNIIITHRLWRASGQAILNALAKQLVQEECNR